MTAPTMILGTNDLQYIIQVLADDNRALRSDQETMQIELAGIRKNCEGMIEQQEEIFTEVLNEANETIKGLKAEVKSLRSEMEAMKTKLKHTENQVAVANVKYLEVMPSDDDIEALRGCIFAAKQIGGDYTMIARANDFVDEMEKRAKKGRGGNNGT